MVSFSLKICGIHFYFHCILACVIIMSVRTKTMSTLAFFFNQIRNCILRTTLCASGAKTNNRCLSVCMFLIACVCPGLPLWHLTKPLIRITSARLVWEWGSGASHWTEENTAGIWDSLLCQTHIQRHTRTSAQRKEHTHSHTQKWLKF